MTKFQLLLRSLRHHRWLNLAVLLAVAVATVALTGALIVGDSVRGSLSQLMIEQLGPIDLLLLNERFFDPGLAGAARNESSDHSVQVACILPEITIEVQNQRRRSRGVFLSAWEENELQIQRDEIVINAALARELDVQVGDQLVIRLPEINEVPADSPLGRKDGRVQSRAGLRIKEILPMSDWGRLSLSRNQRTVRNAFVALPTIQQALGVGNRVNAIVVTQPDRSRHAALAAELTERLQPTLADFGIRIERVVGRYGENQVAWRALQLTTDRMIWDDVSRIALLEGLRRYAPRELFTYLVNSIHPSDNPQNEIPYSTITALAPDQLREFETVSGTPITKLDAGEIVLNAWAAENLGVDIGDSITITYFDPETTHGQAIERQRSFVLRGVVAMTKPTAPFRKEQPAEFVHPPTRANDPALTPTVEGVTDQDSIDDWDPPFPFDGRRVRPVDDEYWDHYRTTPKAFVSLGAGRDMWASRFGQATSIRTKFETALDPFHLQADAESALRAEKVNLGFVFRTVKQDALAAASGTTPFEALFIGFNFFLIAAALMLIAILVRLGIQLRARELGLLQATGWSARSVSRQLVGETLIITATGSVIGTVLGILGAVGILATLRTWWVRAITTPFVQLVVEPRALLIGLVATVVMAMLVAWWTIRKMTHVAPTTLLRGGSETAASAASVRKWPVMVAWTLLALAVVVASVGAGAGADGMAQAGAFFGSGALLLVALLLLVRFRLLAGISRPDVGVASLMALAAVGAVRHPGRSTLTVGLVASAVFLIIAIAAFRLEPTESGTGGFDLVALADRPIFENLNDSSVRQRELPQLPGEQIQVISVRVKPGDDASCRNLFRVSQPQLLGITPEFVQRFERPATAFAWAGAAKDADGRTPANPWELLTEARGPNDPIPVILDKNTAKYSLHLAGRVGEEFTIDYDPPVRFRTAALVFNTILQGSLLVAESDFERLFPDVAGYRMLLVDAPRSVREEAKNALERRYSDEGLDVQDTRLLLADLLAVQNTYLSTFQSLGALGLLLGTLGVALVQLRSVIERQGEMALLQTIGFSKSRVGRVVLLETLYLLIVGVAVGIGSALIAVAPHILGGDANLPLFALALMLLVIVLCGLLASAVAVRAARRVPILETLRREF